MIHVVCEAFAVAVKTAASVAVRERPSLVTQEPHAFVSDMVVADPPPHQRRTNFFGWPWQFPGRFPHRSAVVCVIGAAAEPPRPSLQHGTHRQADL